MKLVLSIKEASAQTGLAECAIRRLCKEGTLPHIKVGVKVLINREVLLRYLRGDVESSDDSKHEGGKIRRVR